MAWVSNCFNTWVEYCHKIIIIPLQIHKIAVQVTLKASLVANVFSSISSLLQFLTQSLTLSLTHSLSLARSLFVTVTHILLRFRFCFSLRYADGIVAHLKMNF